MTLIVISTVRIQSCIVQQLIGNTKKPFEAAIRQKRLGFDRIKDTYVDETEEEKTEENVRNYNDYEENVNDYLFFDRFLEEKEEKKDKEIIIFVVLHIFFSL